MVGILIPYKKLADTNVPTGLAEPTSHCGAAGVGGVASESGVLSIQTMESPLGNSVLIKSDHSIKSLAANCAGVQGHVTVVELGRLTPVM